MQRVIVVEPDKCTGCRICELVCSFFKEGECNPTKSRIRVVSFREHGIDQPVLCLQCEDPPCMATCPVGALKWDTKVGAVILNTESCIGCKLCMMVCPIGAISLASDRRIRKCDLCSGEPKCVKYCPTKAIDFVDVTRAASSRQRSRQEVIVRSLLRAREESRKF